ncbi:MAG: ATP-binding protein [Gammaproteobacteria bacterium]|nr:ATP-binding protein [Gammaproteobacteria bacterium]MCP4881757.1 ATP-binding protein [Gammaproteobacteria bacterium]MDP6166308.1 ATP-binding protein [Gammaproteobacteria bacterium]
MSALNPKQCDQIIKSLRSGVVPVEHIDLVQVGRVAEKATLDKDVSHIAQGGSCVRFVTGEYGSGKTFMGEMLRQEGIKSGLVVASTALAPDKRLQARGGETRNLYSALVRSLSTKARGQGSALVNIVERFILSTLRDAHRDEITAHEKISERLREFEEMASGFDFIKVVQHYWRGLNDNDDRLKSEALRWLRGEYATLTDAKKALGVRSIINYRNFLSSLKMLCQFVQLAGYQGLLICLDEMVALHELTNKQARINNFNEILNIVNDCLQGQIRGMGFVFLGTPEFIHDPQRGLYSLPALKSRLAPNRLAQEGLQDVSGPVIALLPLQEMEMDELLQKLRYLYAYGDVVNYQLNDGQMWQFLFHCREVFGDAYYLNPRLAIKSFLDLLAIIEQNPNADFNLIVAGLKA